MSGQRGQQGLPESACSYTRALKQHLSAWLKYVKANEQKGKINARYLALAKGHTNISKQNMQITIDLLPSKFLFQATPAEKAPIFTKAEKKEKKREKPQPNPMPSINYFCPLSSFSLF